MISASVRCGTVGMCLGVLAWAGSAASAVSATISNGDAKTYQLRVTGKSGSRSEMLGPGKTIREICTKGCVVRLNDDPNNEWELEGDERVTIEDGLVFYDGPENKPGPEQGVPEQGAKP
ncbi:MAG: hypothetical protein AAGC70_12470 [Pseudomonadota bacterium]